MSAFQAAERADNAGPPPNVLLIAKSAFLRVRSFKYGIINSFAQFISKWGWFSRDRAARWSCASVGVLLFFGGVGSLECDFPFWSALPCHRFAGCRTCRQACGKFEFTVEEMRPQAGRADQSADWSAPPREDL